MEEEQEIVLNVKWAKRTFTMELVLSETVGDLRARLFSLTDVLPEHQKLIGLAGIPMKAGPGDAAIPLASLKLKKLQYKILLVGTPSDQLAALESHQAAALLKYGDVIDDFDMEDAAGMAAGGGSGEKLLDEAKAKRRLERRIAATEILEINAPRPDSKLLVLDLDYTLFDARSSAPTVAELGRPGLHQFLATCYEANYDLVIWSQTSWRWLEAKITELAMLTSPDYKISWVMDRTSMFSVTSQRGMKKKTHEVKALEIIWRKYPGKFSDKNTIHIDDLRRNFIMNPQSGLKISAFRNAPVTRATDRELYALEKYLKIIAREEDDFSKLEHNDWKDYVRNHEDGAQNGDANGGASGEATNGNPPDS